MLEGEKVMIKRIICSVLLGSMLLGSISAQAYENDNETN